MTRSSRHKSSKRSSKEARDYSDSEKDLSLKDRKGKDESSSVRVSKESGGSGEKRKLDLKDSKDVFASGNGDYVEEYNSSSKRRKDRADDSVNDRWNGGGEDNRMEVSRKSKVSSETKSKRRDDNDEQQRSKSEGKQRESSRKESREVEREKERKGKEGKSERFVESDEHNRSSIKQLAVNEKTDVQDPLPGHESENQLERRVRRRRDGSGDGDKHEIEIGNIDDGRRDDVSSDGRLKDEKHKDEKHRDKYREDVDRDSRHRDDKQREDRPARDHASSRSDEKHLRDEKDAAETRQKKSKSQGSDRDREREYGHDRDHDHERDFDPGRDRDRDHNRERDRDRDHDGDREWDRERNRELERERDRDRRDRDRDRDRERDRERDRDRDRNRDRDRDFDHDRDRDIDYDGSHHDERSVKYKDSRGKKRSPDERDDCDNTKSRGTKTHYNDMENKSVSSSRVESDADRGRSQSRQAYLDSTVSSSRRRTSPSSSSHGGTDEYRHSKQEDLKYRDYAIEQRPKAISSREVTGFSGVSERGSKYRSTERGTKMDDGHLGELSVERSSSSKASPMGLAERSPSSTSIDRRYINRSGIRRSLDVEETGRRSSIAPRELSNSEERLSRDLPFEKPLVDESSQMDLLFYNRTSQSNSSSSLPPPPAFRAGLGSPSFMGPLEEDGRLNVGARYRRGGDPSMGRGQGNVWRGAPNWSSPVPNGFIHFQHGPPPGGFQAMMPKFPSPSLFNVRPSMEINHSGIPYHIPDADRFSGHLRSHGWQNMMDGSGPPHLHGWDGNNGVFREEPHMYGGSEWDQNRQLMNGRGWETSAEMWKGENGDVNMDLPSTSQKEDHPPQAPLDDDLPGQDDQQAKFENDHLDVQEKSVDTRFINSAKESSKISPKTSREKTSDPSKISSDDNGAHHCLAYLSKLDISEELTAPELYSQCMILLDLDRTATIDKETTVIVNLKDGGKAVPKSSKTLLSPPFFPAANDSVFQRAMEQYRKQKVQMNGLRIVDGGTLDIFPTSNLEKKEQGSLCDVEKVEEPVLISDREMSDAPISTSDHKKPGAVSHADVREKFEELASTPCQVAQDQSHTHPLNLNVDGQESTPKRSEEPVAVFNGDKIDGITSEKQVMSEDADGDNSPSPENASNTAADGGNVDGISMGKSNNSEAINDGLFLSDGSPKESGPLMPGSNESESESELVNLSSRIHHSPESTH